MAEPRYVIIHGHFYQPPRESPWTGLISAEAGAAPFPNWNERILSECYIANAHAHVMDGRVAHIRNNYDALNFDFGPTLISWLRAPRQRSLSGDPPGRRGKAIAKHGGHGNAIAQSYNHSILPLLRRARSRVANRLGCRGFRRIASDAGPKGCGCPNAPPIDDTLRDVAAAGMKFIILAPEQGTFQRRGGRAPRRRPVHLAGGFAEPRGVSFRPRSFARGFLRPRPRATASGSRIRSRRRRAEAEPGGLVMVATDGETFGHHKRLATPNWRARSTRWSCAMT